MPSLTQTTIRREGKGLAGLTIHNNYYIPTVIIHIFSQIDGINGTMIANRKEPADGAAKVVRTVVTLDNGGDWNYITPPETDLSGAPVMCEPPSCSLHFHMASSEYARLGVYSQV